MINFSLAPTLSALPSKSPLSQDPIPTPEHSNQRLAVVDGLRGTAFIAVFFFHVQMFALSPGGGPWRRAYSSVADIGWAGVDLFFVLSGFLITGILIKFRESGTYYRTFYARRTIRIFPLYYLSLFMFFAVAPLALKSTGHAGAIRAMIMPSSQWFAWSYTLNWLRGFTSDAMVPTLIGHFWTLSIEEQFYLVWPILVRHLLRRGFAPFCILLVVISTVSRISLMSVHLEAASHYFTFSHLDGLFAQNHQDARLVSH